MNWVREHASRGALLFAVALSIWSATTLQARQDDLAAAQRQIRATAVQAKAVAEQLAAFQDDQAVLRVLSSDQRCESVRLDVELLDRSRVPAAISQGKRRNLEDCRHLRATYLLDLTPAQRAEYQRRAAEAKR